MRVRQYQCNGEDVKIEQGCAGDITTFVGSSNRSNVSESIQWCEMWKESEDVRKRSSRSLNLMILRIIQNQCDGVGC